jgi:hypothetical protein
LRVPCAITTKLPRIVLEIGFWDAHNRRTVVLEYDGCSNDRKALWGAKDPQWNLDGISLVQSKRVPTRGFVGRTTVADDITVLPTKAPFDLQDLPWSQYRLRQSVVVDLSTMKRTVLPMNDSERETVQNRMMDTFSSSSAASTGPNNDCFRQVLPNALCVSVPNILQRTTTTDNIQRCIFAHPSSERTMEVIELEYEGSTLQAKSVTLHSFVTSS